MKKKVLFSVPDFEKLLYFGRRFNSAGWVIIATADAARVLNASGIPAVNVAEFNGVSDSYPFPPTLHPKMEEVLTSEHGDRIDMVFDLPYPLSQGIDVGGWTLLELAAKGKRLPVCTMDDMELVLGELDANRDPLQTLYPAFTYKMRIRHVRHLAELLEQNGDNSGWAVGFDALTPLLWGENPYQAPACLADNGSGDPLALPRFRQVSGELPCFTNMADTDAMLHCLSLTCEAFQKNCKKLPYVAAAGKHGNPCGLAVSWNSPEEAIRNALYGDPISVWGGEFITNFPLSEELALMLVEDAARTESAGSAAWMLDVIAVPAISEGALVILGKRKARKIFVNENLLFPCIASGSMLRYVRGGALRQPVPDYILDLENEDIPADGMDSLIVSWAAAFSSAHGGNEVALARAGSLLSVAGGPSTVAAARTAVLRANANHNEITGCVFAADAFFPFTDAPEILIEGAGVTGGIVPAGGKNIKMIQDYFSDANCAVIYLPENVRGFIRH
ncbi:MAG: hypothetical protein A2020_07275 [Lentisphaerae bacterium GWF2_45_14]|nr:MAG: hypothetical protein A2020_07275 [Lentisphaerae bacterium GWF2_45_14]